MPIFTIVSTTSDPMSFTASDLRPSIAVTEDKHDAFVCFRRQLGCLVGDGFEIVEYDFEGMHNKASGRDCIDTMVNLYESDEIDATKLYICMKKENVYKTISLHRTVGKPRL